MEISAGTATSLVELRSFSGFTSWLTFGSHILRKAYRSFGAGGISA
jgi:hypothetical protein